MLLLITSSQGCGTDESREGPPFEPGNIEAPESLLVTDSDIEAVGASTPYGAILRWWQALQSGDLEGVERSFGGELPRRDAIRQIEEFRPPTSQPIDPRVETQGYLAMVHVVVRAAKELPDTPGVVRINDYRVTFPLVRRADGWKLVVGAYARYLQSRRSPQPAS
jgi:hypothetical protein